jgi:NAD(P)-dependent dehydrogenase (short-subunit alcohol dehydrogenase family)
MRLDNKVALITGSASGIGKAISVMLAKQGANVIISDNNQAKLEETYKTEFADSQKTKTAKGLYLTLDVTKEAEVKTTIEKIVDEFGKLDIVVNNAGVLSSIPIMELDEREWDRVISTNLKGTFLVTKWAMKEMARKKYGRIINIASNCGKTGQKFLSHYTSSKHGVVGFTQSSALEAAPYNILINAVCPGPVETELHFSDLEMQSKNTGISKETLLEAELKTIPLHKLAKPEEVARLVLFLVSDENTYITGSAINISGGLEVH